VNENIDLEINFGEDITIFTNLELSLIESVMPDLIRMMMEQDETEDI